MEKKCYHLCTTALKESVLCQDKKDYLFLWNSIAICAATGGIKIYCLCLMSNHFHILLLATEDDIDSFFARLKSRIGHYLKQRYGKVIVAGLEYELYQVVDRKAFRHETAYILRNPYKAKIDSPLSYPWSSVMAYFIRTERVGTAVKDMRDRVKRAVLNSCQAVPGNMLVSPEGMILPESFVDWKSTEKMFGESAIQFFDLLKKWNLEDIVNESHGETVTDAYSDDEVLAGIREICRDNFGGLEPERMPEKTLARLIRRVHARFGSSRAQLLRLLPTDGDLLDRLL